jgi:hypothetical protein
MALAGQDELCSAGHGQAEACPTARCAAAHSPDAFDLISVAISAVLTVSQAGMSELRHEIVAACKEYGG